MVLIMPKEPKIKDSKRKPSKTQIMYEHIRQSFEYHDQNDWRRKCNRILGYLMGDWGKSGEENKYVVNTIYNLTNLLVPNLMYQAPWIRVNPTKRWVIKKEEKAFRHVEASRCAVLFEHVINNVINKLDMETEWRRVVQDSLTYGFGVLKVGYDPGKTEIDENIETISKGEIFSQRICPFDFGWDPMASGPEDSRFLIQRIVKPLSDVQKDKNLKNTEELRGGSLSEETSKFAKKDRSKENEEWVELYEYHDQVEDKIYTLAKEYQEESDLPRKSSKTKYKILWERNNPHNFKGSHFVVLKFTGDNDKFVGAPMLSMIEDEALAINETTTMMVMHLRQFPGVIMHEQGAVDEDELTAFENGEQGSILSVQNGALREGRVQRTPPLPMGGEYFQTIGTLGALVDKVLGVPDFQRQVSTKRKTATEVSYEGQDSAIRRAYLIGFVKKFIIKNIEKIASLIQQYYDEEREIRITGEFDEFWKYNNSDFGDNIEDWQFDFDVESMRVYSASRAQGLINGLTALAQFPILQPVLNQLDPEAIAVELFKNLDVNFEAIKRTKSISHLEYDPNQENDFAEQGIRIADPKPGEPHEQHIQLHTQKAEQLLAEKGPEDLGYQELMRHIQMHQFIQQAKGMMPGNQMMQSAPQGTPSVSGSPLPAGGVVNPGQSTPNTGEIVS